MFDECRNFTGKGLENWDVSNVTNMRYMFNNCRNFNSDLSNWDVSNVEDMTCMFYNCKKLNFDLSKWDISNINDMQSMFIYCEQLKQDFSTWNIDQNKVDCYTMFKGCNKMKDELLPKGITI